MNANMHNRINASTITLVRLSTTLRDDTLDTPLRPPLRPATATTAECLSAKGVRL